MAQKIIKIGSSAGVTLSPDALKSARLDIGDAVDVSVHPASRTITMRPRSVASGVSPDVITWTNVFIEKNRALLKRLADR